MLFCPVLSVAAVKPINSYVGDQYVMLCSTMVNRVDRGRQCDDPIQEVNV